MIFPGESSRGVRFSEKKEARGFAKARWKEYLLNSSFEKKVKDHLIESISAWPPGNGLSGRILAYLPLPDEIDVLDLLYRTGRPLYIPRVLSPTEMEFRLVSLDRNGVPDSTAGYGNIRGGREEEPLLGFPLHSSDILVLPSLATGIGGERLGRGGGYFDRMKDSFLPSMVVTILPSELVSLNFPVESHDLRVNRVITEGEAVDY